VSKANILIITCHDLGDFIGPYGVPVATPNLNLMAREGVMLENHFSCSSVCSPSRGGMLTGCYPHTNGLMGLVHRGWELDADGCPPLPGLLARAGYEANLFGFQHEHWDPRRIGYQNVFRPDGGNHCEEVVGLFIPWLRERAEQNQEKQEAGEEVTPFLASIGFTETHRLGLDPSHFRRDVYQPAEPSEVDVPPYLPDIPEVRRELADFYGAVKHVDEAVGRIVQALDETGMREETLLIFTSDHGPSFMHAKGTLYDAGCKVAMLIRWPRRLPGGRRCEALTSHVDVLPTVFQLIGVRLPKSLVKRIEGESFASLLYGGSTIERGYVFAERNYTNYYDPARMVRSARFKYIRKALRTCIFDFVIPELELCPTSFRRNRQVFDFYPARRCTEELYDLEADPGEMSNLLEDPAHADQLDTLRSVLDSHMEETDDPFRHLRCDLLMPERGYERQREAR
jgi:arylsulfatase A-like enzyme